MEYKRRRINRTRSEIDRLLSDEGTRNLLSGLKNFKVLNKSKKLARVTRNGRAKNVPTNVLPTSSSPPSSAAADSANNSTTSSNNKSRKIIKKSLSLLGASNRINKGEAVDGVKLKNGAPPGMRRPVGRPRIKINNGVGATRGGQGSTGKGILGTKVGMASMKQPLLATLIRGHVAFITLSYQNHCCSLRTQDLCDLVRKLEEYESRKGISVIVLNSSSDRIFCDGLDYKELIHSDLNKREVAVKSRIEGFKAVLGTLAKSKKLLIASVNSGRVNGFGLIMLGMFDLVYANDKATFSLQKYFQLKQPPEGISVFGPQLQTPTMKSFVYLGKICTATEMNQVGLLVTEVLWDGSRYHEQLASKLQNVNFNQQTKSIYKAYSAKSLKQHGSEIGQECTILETLWLSDSWQKIALQQVTRDRHNL